MGIVYLGRDPVIGRMVALKTIRAVGEDDAEQKEFRERFLREAQAAGILSHPNIVTVHDVGEDPVTTTSFIAMEYVEGKNVKQLLQERTAFTYERAAEIVGQVAEALDYAHRRGIVHRDVKPANIIITPDGVVKITDFGIAKIEKSNLTSTGQFLGTPNYMSPEQVTGEAVDGRSDLFSLGVVLYELLTRKKPFSGENLTQISYKIVHEAFTPPQAYDASMPSELVTVLTKALAKDPASRYQRGNDFALALYEYKAREEERQMLRDLGQMVAAAEKLGPISAIDTALPDLSAPQAPGAPVPPRPAAAPVPPPQAPQAPASFAPPAVRRLDPDATPAGGVRGMSRPPDFDSTPPGGRSRPAQSSQQDWQLDEEAARPQAKLPQPAPSRPAPSAPPSSAAKPASQAEETGKSSRGRGEERGGLPKIPDPSALMGMEPNPDGLTERISTTDLFGRTSSAQAPVAPSGRPATDPGRRPSVPAMPAVPAAPPASPAPVAPPRTAAAPAATVSAQKPLPGYDSENRPTEIITDAARMVKATLAAAAASQQQPVSPVTGPIPTSSRPTPPAVTPVPSAPPATAPPSSAGKPFPSVAPPPPVKIPEPLVPPPGPAAAKPASAPPSSLSPDLAHPPQRTTAPPPSAKTPPPLAPPPAAKKPASVPSGPVPIPALPATTTTKSIPTSSLKREVTNRYVYLILGGSVLIALAIAGFFLLRRSSEEKPTAPVEDSLAKRVAENRTLMEDGNRLVMEGKYAEALAKYRELANRAPDSAAARDAVQKTEVLLGEQQKRDARTNEILTRLTAARQAQSTGDDERAIAEAEAALAVDPGNADALALKQASEDRKAATAKAATEQQKKEELAKKKAKPTPTPIRVVETKKEPVAAIPPTPTPATASVKIYFDCPITDGYVMIRHNDKEIFRRTISFGRKSQGGVIEGSVQIPAGRGEFKIWVISTDNSVRQYLPTVLEIPGGEGRTLRLELDTNKKLSVLLR